MHENNHAESQLLEEEMENGGSEILEPHDHVLVSDSPRPCGGYNSYAEVGPQQQEPALRFAGAWQRAPPPIPSLYGNVSICMSERA